MLTWVVATTKRIVVVGGSVWLASVAIALLNPLTPQAIATPVATWPLWLSIPVVVVLVALQFGSWAAAVTIPIIGYALIAHGRPWRENTRATGRPERSRRASRASTVDSTLVDTIISHTRINPRRTETKGMTA